MLEDSELSTILYLPQELVDNIIDHLHDDPLTLNSCSLVCRAWLPTTRLHLFSKISLNASPSNPLHPSDLCRRLHHLLTSSPSIIPNIHELDICEGSPLGSPQASLQAGPHCSNRSTTWITTERTFPQLLRMLTNIKRLEFSSQHTLHWGTLPPTLQSAIGHVFSLPSLAYIRLKSWSFSNFSDLADLFAGCQNLKGLALSSTRVCNDSDDLDLQASSMPDGAYDAVPGPPNTDDVPAGDAMLAGPRRCPLEFLTLDYVDFGYLGYWLLSQRSTIELKSLRELRVAHFHDVTAIERLLLATGSSLENFHLKPGQWNVHSFDLGLNSGLRSIRLTLEDPLHALTWVKTLISSITPTNVLERIGIEFYTDLKQMGSEGWAELDALLVRPELAALRQVDIGLFAAPTGAEFTRVRDELSGLHARGVLRLYQLGVKSQRSSRQLMPRISRYEYN